MELAEETGNHVPNSETYTLGLSEKLHNLPFVSQNSLLGSAEAVVEVSE